MVRGRGGWPNGHRNSLRRARRVRACGSLAVTPDTVAAATLPIGNAMITWAAFRPQSHNSHATFWRGQTHSKCGAASRELRRTDAVLKPHSSAVLALSPGGDEAPFAERQRSPVLTTGAR